MFKEIIGFFSSSIRERVSSPIIGTFIVIWCTQNWRGIYILFRPLPTAHETIKAFDAVSSDWTLAYTPAILTILYLMISPWMHRAYFNFQAKPREERVIAEIKLKIALLNEKKKVTIAAYELEDIKVEREHKLEIRKLEALADVEDSKQRAQLQLENTRSMQEENRIVRINKLEMQRGKNTEVI